MIQTAKKLEVDLRPHMKTHKTLEIGEMMAPSKSKISVSTLSELEFFGGLVRSHGQIKATRWRTSEGAGVVEEKYD